ncbi:MAG: IS66 family transposase [Deltaproteobacteria bacterium]|nr:IS66 family transposase [Deltaproteobacteria bacterium]
MVASEEAMWAGGGLAEALRWEAEARRWQVQAQRLDGDNVALRARVAALDGENVALRARVAELEGQLAAVQETAATLARRLFGDSSEQCPKQPGGRPQPQGEPGSAEADGGDGDGGGAGGARASGRRRGRGQQPGSRGHGRRDYSHLPVEEVVHEPDPETLVCPACGAGYAAFGEETCEQVDWQVVLRRVVHRRPTYRRGCGCDEAKGVVAAPPPPKPIPKGRFTSGFIARLLVAKFGYGLPVHRVVGLLASEGASFAPGALCGVLEATAGLLAPLAAAIAERNAQGSHLHIDETSWKVFEPLAGKANNRWWCWVFVGADTTVFAVKPGRGASVVAEHLGIDLDADTPALPDGRALVVSSDFYTPYQRLGRDVEGVANAWCWAHMRRYFLRAGQAHADLAQWTADWLERIGGLFTAHRAWALAPAGSAAEAAASQTVAAAVARIDTARHAQAADAGLAPAAAKVLATLGREWGGLVAFLEQRGVPLDNNSAERALRGPVVARKNCYGSGAHWSAKLAADAWTILATAAQHGLNPTVWLGAYLDACAAAGGKPPPPATLAGFLPWTADAATLTAWQHTPGGPSP